MQRRDELQCSAVQCLTVFVVERLLVTEHVIEVVCLWCGILSGYTAEPNLRAQLAQRGLSCLTLSGPRMSARKVLAFKIGRKCAYHPNHSQGSASVQEPSEVATLLAAFGIHDGCVLGQL